MRLMILFIWRVWFYILASIPVIVLFPFLAIAAFHPKGYNFILFSELLLNPKKKYTKTKQYNKIEIPSNIVDSIFSV